VTKPSLISCWRNSCDYYQCWTQLCCWVKYAINWSKLTIK